MHLLRNTTYTFAILSALAGVFQSVQGFFPHLSHDSVIEARPFCDEYAKAGQTHIGDQGYIFFLDVLGKRVHVPEKTWNSYAKGEKVQVYTSYLNNKVFAIEGENKRHEVGYYRPVFPFWMSIFLYFLPLVVFISAGTQGSKFALSVFLTFSLLILSVFFFGIYGPDWVNTPNDLLSFPD